MSSYIPNSKLMKKRKSSRKKKKKEKKKEIEFVFGRKIKKLLQRDLGLV